MQFLDIQQIRENLQFFFKIVCQVLVVSSLLEIVFFFSVEAVFCIAVSLVGIYILKIGLLRAEMLLYYPVSTVAVLMYVISFLVLPYPATLLEFKPVIYNLHNPYETFLNILLLECLLMASQSVYIKIVGKRNSLRNLLLKTPVYASLTSSELWFLIVMSVSFYVYVMMSMGLYTEDGENIGRNLPPVLYMVNLLVSGFHSLVFLFLFRKLGIIKNESYKIHRVPIVIVAVLLFFVGIATNMRTAAIEVVSVGVFLFVYYWLIHLSKDFFSAKKILFAIGVIWFFFGPFMDISKTMVLIRNDRYGLSGADVLEMTFSGLKDVDDNEDNAQVADYEYSEKYLSNDILQRFCSVKILDETLYRAHQAGYGNENMLGHLEHSVADFCPRFLKPVLRVPLAEVNGSLTDRLAVEAGSAYAVGGIKIGTLQGLGLALYGWWWVPIVFLLYIPIFYLMDSLAGLYKGRMRYSWAFLMNVVAFCYWFSDRHYYVWEYRFLLRGYVEMIIFSCITIWIVKRLPILKH